MSESKHTPGPWAVGEDDELNGCPFIPIMAADGGCIAEMVPDYSEDHPHIGEIERATARLIAAAPEMFDALKALVDALDGRVHSSPALRALSDARAALAKARGE